MSQPTKKLEKVLGIRCDAPDLLSALVSLSEFYDDNSLAARRALRSDIERQSIKTGEQFLASYRPVFEGLQSIKNEVDFMSDACSQMKERLDAAYAATTELVAHSEQLKEEERQSSARVAISTAFLERFQLNSSEKAILTEPTSPINEAFFAALEKAKRVHSDCKSMLLAKHQRAGLEIMDSMAATQDIAYERLFRFFQQTCRVADGDMISDVSPVLTATISALKERTALYESSIEEFASARRNAISRQFFTALTRGGAVKPIEIHAHDPLRYVGDLAAWVHQVLASERETVVALLQTDGSVAPILDSIFQGIARPFRVRVEQVLSSESLDEVVCYKLANLLEFYKGVIAQLLSNSTSVMVTAMVECRDTALTAFFQKLQNAGMSLLTNPSPCPADLQPPLFLHQSLSKLEELVKSFRQISTPAETDELDPVVTGVVDPLLQACSVSASGLSPADVSVLVLNCVTTIRDVLDDLNVMSPLRKEMLIAQIEANLTTVVNEEAGWVLTRVSLLEIVNGVHDGVAMGDIPGGDSDSLRRNVAKFMEMLESGELPMPHCKRILDARLRSSAAKNVAKHVIAEYGTLFRAIESTYPSPRTIAPHTPSDIAKLLCV